jgi:hypothetical protein
MFLVEYPLRHLEDISAWHEKHNSLGQLVSVILVMGTTLEFSKEPLKIGFLASTKITAILTTALLWTYCTMHDDRTSSRTKEQKHKAQSTKHKADRTSNYTCTLAQVHRSLNQWPPFGKLIDILIQFTPDWNSLEDYLSQVESLQYSIWTLYVIS